MSLKQNPVTAVYRLCKRAMISVLFFSFFSNLLMLVIPIYSLQVLDRVISSGSVDTLIALSIGVVGVLAFWAMINMARSFIMVKIGRWFDEQLSERFFTHAIRRCVLGANTGASQELRDVNEVKQFLTGPQMSALLDAPWAVIYFGVLYMIHPSICTIAFGGAVMMLFFAILSQILTKGNLARSNELFISGLQQADIATRNAESIEAMGMNENVTKHWRRYTLEASTRQEQASKISAVITSASRFVRMAIQAAITGTGAYLTLQNDMSVGGMIASSILTGRALAPFDSVISLWQSIISVRGAFGRIKASIEHESFRGETIELPAPKGRITFEKVLFVPPSANVPTLREVSFTLEPGEILGVVGPSASGKTSIAKIITGIWKPFRGAARLDGAEIYSWPREDFGRHVGYLPQEVELFHEAIWVNIARMDRDANHEEVIKAAQFAGAHEMILQLPQGYDTQVGKVALSGGQKQRIALARALFGSPRVVVLDEPNANLDRDGDIALADTLRAAKQAGITVIIISHRPSIMAEVDKIMVVKNGAIAMFGDRDEVLREIKNPGSAKTDISMSHSLKMM